MGRIILDQVGKKYGGVSVLKNIDLEVEDGEFVVLVGPSGCGKSTLLRMIAGLEDITCGRLSIDGKVANHVPAKARGLAMVFQNYALYPHMKVSENMSFSLRLAGASKSEIAAKVQEAAKILGLTEFLDRLPKELSGGQRQRVAMGRAIIRNPVAFLFDEPLSNLDAKLRVRMRSEIKKLHQALGKTTIYVTHDQTEAMTMADRIVVLNDGGIAQTGTPDALYNNPSSAFVASFIGSPEINLIAAKTLGPNEESVRIEDGTKLPLAGPLEIPAGRDISYGIRPQTIDICDGGPIGQVQLVEPTGETADVTLLLAGQKILAVLPNSAALSPGDMVPLGLNATRSMVFDPVTGARLQ